MVLTGQKISNKSVPGWSEHVAPLREKSVFWHNLWVDCGRPRTGVVADTMRQSRAAYHYAICSIRKNESDIIKMRFANTVLENHSSDFCARQHIY